MSGTASLSLLVPTCAEYLDQLVRDAVDCGITLEVARYCGQQSLRRFATIAHMPAGRGLQRRLAAYFEAVVRAQVKRSRGAALASVRRILVLTTIAEDLAGVGASRERMLAELSSVFGPSVPAEDVARVVDSVACRRAS